jgi:transketolase C-terminal domain/subunit
MRSDAGDLAIGISIGGLKVITQLNFSFFQQRAWSRIQSGIEKNPAVRDT